MEDANLAVVLSAAALNGGEIESDRERVGGSFSTSRARGFAYVRRAMRAV